MARRCPICRKATDPRHSWYPFCSPRCRTQDLANWATGTYSIAAPASEADEHLDPQGLSGESGSDG